MNEHEATIQEVKETLALANATLRKAMANPKWDNPEFVDLISRLGDALGRGERALAKLERMGPPTSSSLVPFPGL
jgi:hypothetical protein